MSKFLPIIFLASVFSFFGVVWIVFDVDPDNAPIYIYLFLDLLIFSSILGFLGLMLYFLRTRLHKRYSQNWYFYTSFKMAFFAAAFVAIALALAFLQLVSFINLLLVILALTSFALWSYLGKKSEDK